MDSASSKKCTYVADELEEPCILGLDYLIANRCELDFDRQTLRIGNTLVPLVMGPLKTRTSQSTGDADAQPQYGDCKAVSCISWLSWVSCKADGDVFTSLGMVETHTTLATGVMTGRTLVAAARSSLHVLMANLSDKPVRLHSDTLVGMCEPVEVVDVHVDEKKKEKLCHGMDHFQNIFKN